MVVDSFSMASSTDSEYLHLAASGILYIHPLHLIVRKYQDQVQAVDALIVV